MSAAVAQNAAGVAAPAKGKKKLIVILAAVLLLVLAGGGGAVFVLKQRAAAAAAAEEDEGAAHAQAEDSAHPAIPPTFLPLEPFVVNLADRDIDRYAQIGITLEIEEAAFADKLKAYMPAIRNGILMVLAHKTSTELLERKGKEALAFEIMRESVRPLGIELEDSAADEAATDEGATPRKNRKTKRATPVEDSPVRHVHFSNFIIQ